jgi:phosphoenolpyruvate synthase/pyruvate phosphate dikinase
METLSPTILYLKGSPTTSELKAFRKLVKSGSMPGWMMGDLAKLQQSFANGQGIRCRSSTNNEDLPDFSGAGLYDSFTHKSDEGHLAKTIKQVFASLWNFRTFEERTFYRIDHFTTAIGVLVHLNFSDELANGVAVTDDILYQTKGNYYFNTQVGENLVTNPDADSIPEELLLDWWRTSDYKVMRKSNQLKDNKLIMTEGQLEQMNRYLGRIHSKFSKLYGTTLEDTKLAMKIEFKITKDGTLSIKQARPWVY